MDDATNCRNNISYTHFQDSSEEEEEEEESLSLSGLVSINSDDGESIIRDDNDHDTQTRCQDLSRSSSSDDPSSDFFEFFSDLGSEISMSHAEDIIFCGKLIPFRERQINHQPNDHQEHIDHHKKQPTRDEKLQSFRRRRCESMPEATACNNSNPMKTKLVNMRNSRSLDYQKLYGSSKVGSEKMEMERSLSSKSAGKSDVKEKVSSLNIPKSRWYFLTFGLVKFPPEMGLQDMKSRQIRRNPGTLFSSFHSDEKGNVSDRRSYSWDLLRVLSCKDDESVAVTTSFSCLQRV